MQRLPCDVVFCIGEWNSTIEYESFFATKRISKCDFEVKLLFV